MERPKAAGMFAICPGFTMSANHLVENPFIGKVTPPFGPWKDST